MSVPPLEVVPHDPPGGGLLNAPSYHASSPVQHSLDNRHTIDNTVQVDIRCQHTGRQQVPAYRHTAGSSIHSDSMCQHTSSQHVPFLVIPPPCYPL